MRKLLTFRRIVWMLGLSGALAVAFGPLVREYFARRTWLQVPCYLAEDHKRFIFEWQGRSYVCARMNLWYAHNADAYPAASHEFSFENNDHCFVNKQTPPIAVLRLDASHHLEQGAGCFAAGGLFLASVSLLCFADVRRQRSRHSSKVTGPLPH